MVSVTFIKKTKTALLVPNALVIETKSYQVREALFTNSSYAYVLFTSMNLIVIIIVNNLF